MCMRSVKNFKTRCEGLSPFLFVYSITGNTTYVLAILAASMDLQHLIANASWIAGEWYNRSALRGFDVRFHSSPPSFSSGSALTVFLDVFVSTRVSYSRVLLKLLHRFFLNFSTIEAQTPVRLVPHCHRARLVSPAGTIVMCEQEDRRKPLL